MSRAYYSENDPKAAAWLRELIKAGLIADGDVDERSIAAVSPQDLTPYAQCHFFAGIGGWSYALRLAGVPDGFPVWTGSCPCQPFSAAGKGLGEADERHLWPVFCELIRACNPSVVFGEQVASKAGRVWLSGVFADLEGMDYQRAGADLCAAGVGAPHIRQRLFWVANTPKFGWEQIRHDSAEEGSPNAEPGLRWKLPQGVAGHCSVCRLGDTIHEGPQGHRRLGQESVPHGRQGAERHDAPAGAWSDFDILPFRDGKQRRVESGTFPLVAGLPRGLVPSGDPSVSYAKATAEGRVARLRGYGNSIVPQLAAQFILAALECAAIE